MSQNSISGSGVKIQGLGRRGPGISHAEAIAHHRNTHSKLGLGQADHLEKYILYYFQEALRPDGTTLSDFPWDMSALEWFREADYWDNFQQWLASAPSGQEVMVDEARFLDRESCFLLPYEERIIVDDRSHDGVVHLVRLLAFCVDASNDAGVDQALTGTREITTHFGTALRKLVVNRVTEATCLATGKIPMSPVDVIQIIAVDEEAFDSTSDLVRSFSTAEIATAERRAFSAERTVNLIAEQVVFIS